MSRATPLWLFCAAGLVAAMCAALGQPDVPADPPGKSRRPPPPPLPESGSTTTFSYSRSSQYPGVYEIRPVGDPEPSLISEANLQHVLASTQLGDDMKLTAVMAYPVMAIRWYEMVMPKHFPDASSPAPAEAFARCEVTGEDGSRAVIEQDPLAPHYVRVTVRGADGPNEEFSINRQMAEELLADPRFTGSARIGSFRSFPYRLPEQARYDYRKLPAAELYELAARSGTLKDAEMIRMRNIFEDQIRAQAEAQSRTGHVVEVRQEYVEKIRKEWAWKPKAPVPEPPDPPDSAQLRRPPPVVRPSATSAPAPPLAGEGAAGASSPWSRVLSGIVIAALVVGAFLVGRIARP